MRALRSTVGTRGDVQPIVTLASKLRELGHVGVEMRQPERPRSECERSGSAPSRRFGSEAWWRLPSASRNLRGELSSDGAMVAAEWLVPLAHGFSCTIVPWTMRVGTPSRARSKRRR